MNCSANLKAARGLTEGNEGNEGKKDNKDDEGDEEEKPVKKIKNAKANANAAPADKNEKCQNQ